MAPAKQPTWTRHEPALPPSGPWSHLDAVRASRPTVLEEPDGTLRMWYSGHDGQTGRILEARQEPGQPWRRLGPSLEAGSGACDAHGVESPSVVRSPTGFLMAYAGSDGNRTRLHAATSDDGHDWEAQGTLLEQGGAHSEDANHPCLIVTGERWSLFYSGYHASGDGRRAHILAAVSWDGASWEPLGPVLTPRGDELAVSEPCVLVRQRHFTMLFVCDDGTPASIEMATSRDGVEWDRRGTTLRLGESGESDRMANRIGSPVAAHLQDGRLRLWYSIHTGDTMGGTASDRHATGQAP
jgi:predicted GH43/DUF377 family glycosyl hydrolase